MMKASSVPWAKLSFESVLIVVSILAALAIDSWWSDRQESVEEQHLLRQLKAEIEENIAQLSEKRLGHEAAFAAGLRLLSLTAPKVDTGDVRIDDLREDFVRISLQWTFDPHTGVLLGILMSGRLDVIGSEELRTDLAAWPARYQDLAEDEQAVAQLSSINLGQLLTEIGNMRNSMPVLAEIEPSKFSENIDQILTSRKFENILSIKLQRTHEVLGFYDETRSQLADTLSLVESEIQ